MITVVTSENFELKVPFISSGVNYLYQTYTVKFLEYDPTKRSDRVLRAAIKLCERL